MRKGLSPGIRKKRIPGRESSKGQDPKKRTSLLCFRNSERTFIYLRTQSCCPRDSQGDTTPGWLLELLPNGHQRAAVLFPSRLTGMGTLQGHLKSGCFPCAAALSLFTASGHGQHFEICEAGESQFLKLSVKWAKIATSVIQTRIHIGEKYLHEGPGELMDSLSLQTLKP